MQGIPGRPHDCQDRRMSAGEKKVKGEEDWRQLRERLSNSFAQGLSRSCRGGGADWQGEGRNGVKLGEKTQADKREGIQNQARTHTHPYHNKCSQLR